LIDTGLIGEMRTVLREWFGAAVDGWQVLRVDEIPRAHPVNPLGTPHRGVLAVDEQGHPAGADSTRSVWLCGDHLSDPSINGALASGRAAARTVLASRGHG
jgi:predicted NAD/FAD-dependent oxidoreductase